MPKAEAEKTRCPWCGTDPLYVKYHDEEWGVPSFDDRHLYEKLCLEAQQAGLSWITVLKKREAYRKAFFNFDVKKVAKLSDEQVEVHMSNEGLIRHRPKLMAIRDNAIATMAVQKEFGSLSAFLWEFVGGKPVTNRLKSYREAQTATAASEAMAKALKKRGFKFLGPTSVYAFMQSVGMVNDHEISCFRYKPVSKL
ncbi:MAG: DNA-3-methyladenine glycosylase I [Pedobacter sp.]|nr:DNA-3-methyladenine glycosylase I [Pedobacter sp.]